MTYFTSKPRATTKTQYTYEEALAHIKSRTIETETGCHEWQGPLTKDGYGQLGERYLEAQFGIKGVHRLVYHLSTGYVYEGRHEQVLHSCHNRQCCNPDHLSVGTSKENMAQAWERGSFDFLWNNSRSKLNEAKVRAIRARRAAGERLKSIASTYGITPEYTSRIANGHSWSWVE